jgi:Protein of unknown function (DUF3040)
MGLPVREQLVLDTIENDLMLTDPELADAFDAFTAVTNPIYMRAADRAAHPATAIASCSRMGKADRATVLGLAAFVVIGLLLTIATLFASSQGRHHGCAMPPRSKATATEAWGSQPGPTSQYCAGSPP